METNGKDSGFTPGHQAGKGTTSTAPRDRGQSQAFSRLAVFSFHYVLHAQENRPGPKGVISDGGFPAPVRSDGELFGYGRPFRSLQLPPRGWAGLGLVPASPPEMPSPRRGLESGQ